MQKTTEHDSVHVKTTQDKAVNSEVSSAIQENTPKVVSTGLEENEPIEVAEKDMERLAEDIFKSDF